MKLQITDGAAAPLIALAVSMRIVFGVVIDMPRLYCAGWLSALLGGALALPMAFAVQRLRDACGEAPLETNAPLPRAVSAIFAILSALDGAAVMRCAAHTAGYLSLRTTSLTLLLVPQLLLCLWALKENGAAVGSAARVWWWILPWLLLIVILLEGSRYRFAWLTPLLGSGASDILDGAVRTAGWMSLMLPIALCSRREAEHPRRALRPVRLTCFIAVVSAGLILLRNLMTPPLVSGDLTSRYAQFDLLLSNGRAPLTLQFPMIVLWLVSLLMLLLFDVLSVALTLQRALPGLNGKVCVFAAPLSCMALALFGVGARTDAMALARWLYAAQGTLLASLMLQNGKKRGLLRA